MDHLLQKIANKSRPNHPMSGALHSGPARLNPCERAFLGYDEFPHMSGYSAPASPACNEKSVPVVSDYLVGRACSRGQGWQAEPHSLKIHNSEALIGRRNSKANGCGNTVSQVSSACQGSQQLNLLAYSQPFDFS